MKRLIWVPAIAVSVALLAFGWENRAFIGTLFDEGALEAWIRSLGPIGPLAVVVLQTVQIVIAPIPGQFVGMAAGAVYGYELGLALTVVGGTLGTFLAIAFGRVFGHALTSRFAESSVIQFITGFNRVRNPLLWSVVFVLPLGDAVCFAAGLTGVALPRLFLGAFLGRLPQYALAPAVGTMAHSAGPLGWMVGIGLGVLISVLALLYADTIKRRAASLIERFDK